jgi:hypothetical protein
VLGEGFGGAAPDAFTFGDVAHEDLEAFEVVVEEVDGGRALEDLGFEFVGLLEASPCLIDSAVKDLFFGHFSSPAFSVAAALQISGCAGLGKSFRVLGQSCG